VEQTGFSQTAQPIVTIGPLALTCPISLADDLGIDAIVLHNYAGALAVVFELLMVGVGIVDFVDHHLAGMWVYQRAQHLLLTIPTEHVLAFRALPCYNDNADFTPVSYE